MKNLTTRLAGLLLSSAGLLTGALLAQQSPPSADTYVSSSSPNKAYGSSILLVVGEGSTTYMRFNLAGVPTGAIVNKATLRLFVSAVATGGQFDVYNLPATPTWSESTLTYNTPPPTLGSSATGGHSATVSTSSMNNFVLLDITATVQGWLANPSTNNGVGLALVGTTGYFSFESKEGVLTSHEPELEIVLNESSGTGSGTVTSVGTGLGLKGGPITTSGTLNIDTTVVPQLGATNNIFTGNISALSFTGSGAGLINVNAATLNGIAGYNFPSLTGSNNFVGNQTITGNLNIAGIGSTLNVGGPSIFNMDVSPGAAVTSNCLLSAGTGCLGFQFNGLTGNNIFNAQINGTTELNVDGSGNMTLNGGLSSAGVTLPALGTATSAAGFGSNLLNLKGSTFNGSVAQPVQFAFQTVPQNNGASNSSGSLNLLYSQGNAPPQSVLSIANNGVITFASGQNFPGTGSVTSVAVTPGGGLVSSSNPITTTGTLNIDQTVVPLLGAANNNFAGNLTASSFSGNGALLTNVNALTLNGYAASAFLTSGSNTFTGNQTITGNLALSGQLNLPVTSAVSGAASTGVLTLGGSTFAHAYGVNGLNSQNTFYGLNAGNFTMIGEQNIAIGATALASNTSGQSNTAVGSPLHSSTSNRGALGNNTTGSNNTANGSEHSSSSTHRGSSMGSNTTGSNNTGIGTSTLDYNTSGNNNIAVGSLAGSTLSVANANTTGSNNTFVGYNSGPGVPVEIDNSAAIGANALVNCSNCMVLGDSTVPMLVGVGTDSPNATLDVEASSGNPTVKFGSASNPANFNVNGLTASITGELGVSETSGPTSISLTPSGVVLTSVFNQLSGPTMINGLTTINGSLTVTGSCTGCGGGGGGGTITGVIAGTGLSGGGTSGTVTLNNAGVLNVSPGTGIAIGGTVQNPIVNINTNVVPVLNGANTFSGNQNVNGNIAVAGTVSASKLVATGALYLNGNVTNPFAYESGTGAGDNTFVGFAGESVNSTAPGDENTGVGSQALNVNGTGSTGGFVSFGNTAVGAQSLLANTLGNDNTASGYDALGKNTSGGSNTASGTIALFYNVTGSNNTALGYNAGPDSASTGLTYSTAIGAGAVVSANNALTLGGPQGSAAAVNVGIGTASPQYPLDVRGSGTYAASITGNLNVTGTLSKGSGSFKIDHPLDPANKYLYHSFVESPDMLNIYNGVAMLDARGSVWITLPEYFEALNQDFRYQLTSVGRPQPSLYVAKEVSGNRFRISGGKPGGKVSWQVTGIRHDAYADAHRIEVEVEKPPQERGRYLHPELFGAGPEQAVGYQPPPVTAQPSTQDETTHVSSLKMPAASLK